MVISRIQIFEFFQLVSTFQAVKRLEELVRAQRVPDFLWTLIIILLI